MVEIQWKRKDIDNGTLIGVATLDGKLSFNTYENPLYMIPPGRYICVRRQSDKHGEHYILSSRIYMTKVFDISSRLLLLHNGTLAKHSKGCVMSKDLKEFLLQNNINQFILNIKDNE